MVTLEDILTRENLNKAVRQVESKKGAAGVDRMSVSELRPYLMQGTRAKELVNKIAEGRYTPKPVRRVYIPKADSKELRPLGIPCVIDRVVQQAIYQKLLEVYDPMFADESYGYRPNRSGPDAINRIAQKANMGYEWALSLDLSKFFDRVNHEKLLSIMRRTVKDPRVLSLIHKILKAPIMDAGKKIYPKEGCPQGGNLSPICANIILNELDWELKKRAHVFTRYADDILILTKSKRSAERTMASIVRFIEDKLLLKVNLKKTKICKVNRTIELKYLGYAFNTQRIKLKDGVEKKIIAVPHRKSEVRYKNNVKSILKRSRGVSHEQIMKELNQVVRGWGNHFINGSSPTRAARLDGWMRTRIRMLLWKRWKTNANRYRNLIKLGATEEAAHWGASASKKYMHFASTQRLKFAISNEALYEMGWVTLSDVWTYTHYKPKTIRNRRIGNPTYGGVGRRLGN